jgi:hypothetical protein
MGLRVWLPLNGSLENQGISNVTITNTGATVDSAGKIGSCYSFTTSKLIQCVLDKSITSINNSVACWVKFNSLPASGAYVCLLKAGGVGSGYSTGTIILWLEGSQMYVTVKGANPATADKVSHPFTTGIWYHLVATYDGSVAKIYSNGMEIYSKSVVSTGTYTTITSFLVGANNAAGATSTPNPNYGLNGYINDARFYDHALSVKEVRELARGLMVHYKLDMDQSTEPTTNLGGTSINYSNMTYGNAYGASTWGGDAGTVTYYATGGFNNGPYKVYHKTATGTGGIYKKTANDITITSGKTYTVSAYIKASRSFTESHYGFNINGVAGSDSNHYITSGVSLSITTEWKRFSFTFTATDADAGTYGEMSIIYNDQVADYYVYYSCF